MTEKAKRETHSIHDRDVDSSAMRRALIPGAVGNFVEWYDFAVYGFVAAAIATHFFPAEDPTTAILTTFAVFAIPFFLRPVSGVVFGYVGDKVGRRRILALTVTLMAVGTTAVGLLPTYSTVGYLAPILLIVFRCVQGVAAGGEFVGAAAFVLEHTPYRKRGIVMSFLQVGTATAYVFAGFLILLLVDVFGSQEFAEWGWRIMFLVTAPVGAIGLYIRHRMDESPVFVELRSRGQVARHPLRESGRTNTRTMVLGGLSLGSYGVVAYLLYAYLPTYLLNARGFDASSVRTVAALSVLLLVLAIPLFGLLADRWGRKRSLMFACLLAAVVSVPSFLLTTTGGLFLALLGLFLLAIAQAANYAAAPITIVELFPARLRYTSGGISYNLSIALLSGTGPYVATFLVSHTGVAIAPGYYVLAISVMSFLAALSLPRSLGENTFTGEQLSRSGG